jgi:hypothetical protein
MGRRILQYVVFGVVCSLVMLAAMVRQTIAGATQVKESAQVAASVKSAAQEEYPLVPRAKKSFRPIGTERQSGAIQKEAKPARTAVKPKRSRHPRRVNVHKKSRPKVVVQPRTDLMYYGMLESPQRYDPRRNHFGGGIPDPHIPELTHDHFQELDRNQDGTIDPVERTFGRPDMDRDLHDRRPQ